MALPQNHKRRCTPEASQENRPAKARNSNKSIPNKYSFETAGDHTVTDNSFGKTIEPPAVDYHSSWHYPPEFWDGLSTIPLIRSALEELNRRTNTRPAVSLPSIKTTRFPRTLARFARHGGPDLCDLRGYPAPIRHQQYAGAMSYSSQSRAIKPTDPTTVTGSGMTSSKRFSTYHPAFEQHLTDYGIHATWDSEEPDMDTVHTTLAKPRPSLSLSQFPNSAFKEFCKSNARAKNEEDVYQCVFPSIAGAQEDNYPSVRNMMFGNLEPLTNGNIPAPKPDIALGALPEHLNPNIRNELQNQIIPSTSADRLIVPNFFVELKGPRGSAAVMGQQARYDGAVGARGVHSLQNYRQEQPTYDGQAYTYSSTYHSGTGTLQLYTHHPTAPTTPGGRAEYHMTQVRAFGMTDTRETFVQGATAFRNARDLAKQDRDKFIEAANSKSQEETMAA